MELFSRRNMLAGLTIFPAGLIGVGSAREMSRPKLSDVEVIQRSIEVVAGFYAVPVEKLVAPVRWRDVVLPKQKAIYLAYRLSGLKLVEVGRLFSRNDEASVWYPMLHVYHLVSRELAEAAEVRGLASIIDQKRALNVDWDARPTVRR